MDISTKDIVCTTIGEDGNVVRKDKFENRFDELEKYLGNFSSEDSFVMESTGFYEPLYDYIESKGFKVKLANPLKIKLIAESRMKNSRIQLNIPLTSRMNTFPAVKPLFPILMRHDYEVYCDTRKG